MILNPINKLSVHLLVYSLLFFSFSSLSQEITDNQTEPTGLPAHWKTREEARTLSLTIPAPRGQIVDRNGYPLAQNYVGYLLAIHFPHLEKATDEDIIRYAQKRIQEANQILQKNWEIAPQKIVQHYKNRRWLPLVFSPPLSDTEKKEIEKALKKGLGLHPIYLRHYPHGSLAAHIVGYVGKIRPLPTGPIANGDPLFEETEGRDGLELTYNDYLQGKNGRIHLIFDTDGTKLREEMVERPTPGKTVVTTLDLEWQKAAEAILKTHTKRGAFTVIDVHTGEILVLASHPCFDPNDFIPAISKRNFARLNENADKPLFGRAFRGVYPPASTFKPIVVLAGLENNRLNRETLFPCPSELSIGDRIFKNWRKEDEGEMNLVQALMRSCNTWFYQAGIATGASDITSMAYRLGLGKRTGISLKAEAAGLITSNAFMREKYGHPILDGDLANISIGQGRTLASPLQVAQMMAAIANGNFLPRLSLIRQVQDIQRNVLLSFEPTKRHALDIDPENLFLVSEGLRAVVQEPGGTGSNARCASVSVSGKTGTAQWGPAKEKKNVAWFAGFLPTEAPQYAFAVLYEGDPGEKVSGGSKAAPLVREFFDPIYQKQAQQREAEKLAAKQEALDRAFREAEAARQAREEEQEVLRAIPVKKAEAVSEDHLPFLEEAVEEPPTPATDSPIPIPPPQQPPETPPLKPRVISE